MTAVVTYLGHATNPRQFVVVLVADDGGAGMPENPVEEDEVVAEHDDQATRHQHQVQGALRQQHVLSLLFFSYLVSVF